MIKILLYQQSINTILNWLNFYSNNHLFSQEKKKYTKAILPINPNDTYKKKSSKITTLLKIFSILTHK